jgi:hypothetical protein
MKSATSHLDLGDFGSTQVLLDTGFAESILALFTKEQIPTISTPTTVFKISFIIPSKLNRKLL